MVQVRSGVVVVLLCIAMAACATMQRDTYRALSAAASTYEQGMTAVAELDKAGKLTPEVRGQILSVARVYWVAYHGAADALATYAASSDKPNEERLVLAMGSMTSALAALLSEIAKLTQGVK